MQTSYFLCIYRFRGVAGIELIVSAFLLHQFVVRALLNDPAVFENDDTVAVAHGRQPVCDDKGGAPMHELVHALLHDALCLWSSRTH